MANSGEGPQIRFGGDTSDLRDATSQAKDMVSDFGGSVDSLKSSLTDLAGTIVEAFTIDKIAEFVKGTADAAEQIERLHSITDLSTESIQTMQFAMQMTGADASEAGALMTRFQRNLAEASAGSGNAFAAFQRLGISLNELQHASSQKIFDDMIAGFGSISDSSQRADTAIALLGRGAAALLPVISQGRAGWDSYAQKLDETGKKMSPDMVDKFDQLAKDIHVLEDAFIGLGRAILDNFVQPIDTAIVEITKLTEAFQSWSKFKDYISKGNAGEQVYFGNDVAGPPQNKKTSNQPVNRKPLQDSTTQDTGDTQTQNRAYFEAVYQNKKDYDDLMVESGQMSAQKEIADLQQALEVQKSLVDHSFDQQAAQYDSDSTAYQKIIEQKEVADQKFANDKIKLDTQAAKEDAKLWTSAFDTIEKSMDQMLTGILQGTQTMGQLFQRLAQNMVTSLGEAIIKMGLDWAKGELQRTMGATEGAAQRLAVQNAADAEGAAAQKAASSVLIMNDAGLAAAGVYANVANLPGVGWMIAPEAAEEAFATVMAYDSFDVGTPYVPNDMVAQIHKGERILTASENDQLTGADGSFGPASGAHVHFHISSMDSAGVASMMKKHSAAIGAAVKSAARGNTGGIKSAFARM